MAIQFFFYTALDDTALVLQQSISPKTMPSATQPFYPMNPDHDASLPSSDQGPIVDQNDVLNCEISNTPI